MNRPRRFRRGFALLAALWMIAALAALGAMISFAARESIAAARNRTATTRATWRAQDCLERARAAVHDALQGADASLARGTSPWLVLDTVVARSPLVTARFCRLEIRPAGTALDINQADEEMLHRLLSAAGVPLARADSLTEALLDWRDADDVPRPFGAEKGWYAAAGHPVPRNGPFAADAEMALVRGFASERALDTLLSVEPGRTPLAHAPLPVLAAFPGFGDEALARIAESRTRDRPIVELIPLAAELSPEGRAALLAHFAELTRFTTSEPDAWILESHGRDEEAPVASVIEVRLVRAGARAAIVRRRSWVE